MALYKFRIIIIIIIIKGVDKPSHSVPRWTQGLD